LREEADEERSKSSSDSPNQRTKEALHGARPYAAAIYPRACRHQPDRNRNRARSSGSAAEFEDKRILEPSFLVTTVLTSVTGFLFPFEKLLPSHVVGTLSLIALAAAIMALYVFHLRGRWRRVYVVCAVLSLYLNVFVLVVQSFLKIPTLHELAPTGTEAPFVAAQLVTLAVFSLLGFRAFRKASAVARATV
jgi:hypothetical protein